MLSAYTLYKAEFIFLSYISPFDSGNLKITNLDRLIFTKNGEFTI